MTVISPKTKVIHITDSSVSEYPFDFKVFAAKNLAVLVAGADGLSRLALNADYLVSGINSNAGGKVALTASGVGKAGNGLKMIIMRDMPFLQEDVDFINQGSMPAYQVEFGYDVAAMERQQLLEMMSRVLLYSVSEDGPYLTADEWLAEVSGNAEEAKEAAAVAAEGARASEEAKDQAVAAAATVATAIDKHENDPEAHNGNILEVLTISRTYYIRKDGNDNNDGLLPSSALASMARAQSKLRRLHAPGQNITLNFGPGVWAVGNSFQVGDIPVCYQLFIEGGGDDTIFDGGGSGVAFFFHCASGKVTIRNLKLRNVSTGFNFDNFPLKAAVTNVSFENVGTGVISGNGGSIDIGGNFSCSGGFSFFAFAYEHTKITLLPACVITLLNKPSFANFARVQKNSTFEFYPQTQFIGEATGTRCYVQDASVAKGNGAGANALPGNLPVVALTETGGFYVP